MSFVHSSLNNVERPRFTTLTDADFPHHAVYVTCVLDENRSYQLVRVFDVLKEKLKIVKIVSRTLVEGQVIVRDIARMKAACEGDNRHCTFIEDFKGPSFWFLVFTEPRATLATLLRREDMVPLPSRHVREILSQIICATSDLHRIGIFHLDVCPSNVEVLDAATVVESFYKAQGVFESRKILKCARISLRFYGEAGTSRGGLVGADQYRAPEIVYGWGGGRRSDNFSIGCLFWEMLKGAALFPPCNDERLYVKAKTHMFAAILGDLPSDMVSRIQIAHKGIFCDGYRCELTNVDDLSEVVRDYLETAGSIHDAILDKATFDIVDGLLKISADDRIALESILDFKYFDVKD
ncbi:hypothetical protein CVT26_005071 [Gymnopilus dilepis]|uniref:Protein kinase domain-containing protein n=1 Tax=Gymnopilus dilepis TaxID=231916 RepID=A0A409W874_9AGAR|nr:hypothetical protein CVT26_005071 [Gymnopilus dilepis]